MTFRLRITVNQELLAKWRVVPERTQQNFRRKLVTVLGPELQREVNELMRPGPGPSLFGSGFNTPESRRYWFLLIKANPGMTDGAHYIRTGLIEEGFRVFVSDRLRGNQITIRNIQEAAPGNDLKPHLRASYVYGPRLVLGHLITGWVEEGQVAGELLREYAIERCKELFAEALREAVKGQG